MGRTSELLSLLKTGNSDAARRLIVKFKKAGKILFASCGFHNSLPIIIYVRR